MASVTAAPKNTPSFTLNKSELVTTPAAPEPLVEAPPTKMRKLEDGAAPVELYWDDESIDTSLRDLLDQYQLRKSSALEQQFLDLQKTATIQAKDAHQCLEEMARELKRKTRESEELRRELIEAQAQCQLYARLTGVKAKTAEPIDIESKTYEGTFTCSVSIPDADVPVVSSADSSAAPVASTVTVSGPALEFEVGVFDNQVEYTPTSIRPDLEPTMPDFLTSEIDFALSDAPVFLSKLLTEVHRKR